MKMRSIVVMLAGTGMALATVGCQDTGSGALVGAGLGAGAGAILGNNVDGLSRGEGAAIGAAVGGITGGVAGNQQKQINQARSEAAAANTYVVNVRNSNGSVTPVTLNRVANGWQGPRGEIYSGMPTEDQLRGAYGF
ncbi:MAG: hypothetical protein AAF591_01460 [Verrucomicrobiota bacterium]